MPKTEFLQIRVTPEDRNRLRRAAARDFLEPSTWARRAVLRALEQWEDDEMRGRHHRPAEQELREAPAILRVAEPSPDAKPKARSKSTSTSKRQSKSKSKSPKRSR